MNQLLKNTITKSTVLLGAAFVGLSALAISKKDESHFNNEPEQKNPMEGKKVIFIENSNENENADGYRGHLEAIGDAKPNKSLYETYGKRALDILLSFGGLVVLSPILVGTAIAIKIDDPGPVLFTQKRIGKNKRFFKFHKFRSMKMSTPHDVPTHMLENPDQYITRVGKFLRAHSLDELPQIWDIFIGNMSVIGPRPALWNQDVLTAEREKYGVNEIKPGLTGWAQINGRDELELSEKAKMDGEYVQNESLLFDTKCFLGSVHVFRKDESVVEGGTGEMQKNLRNGVPVEDPITVFGCDLNLKVDEDGKKRVLITGAGSYIGESVKKYAESHYPNIHVDTVDMIDGSWRHYDFTTYDCVYHVAGIAHADIGNVSDEIKEKYYSINTDLAIETANKAKEAGVKQFIFMSSMIVYGDSAPFGKEKMITRDTKPNPSNFYGDSKWQADKGIRALDCESFKVAILRPPMIYGKGSKGNYPILAKYAKKLPVFPNVNNQRSMLYIGNLCEFLCKLIMSGERGLYFPQNSEYTKTADMVQMIGDISDSQVRLSRFLNPAVEIASHLPGKVSLLVNKAFGNSCYDLALSSYSFDYNLYSLKESIEITESAGTEKNKKALILASVASMIDQFNIPNIEILQTLGYKVDVVADFTNPGTITEERAELLKKKMADLDVRVFDISIPRSTDPKLVLGAYKQVKRLLEKENYNLLHCQSPIGGAVARIAAAKMRKDGLKVIYTAHGFHFYNGAPLKNWVVFYPVEKWLSRVTDVLITINKEDYERAQNCFYAKQTVYIPGVGIDMEKFTPNKLASVRIRSELNVPNDRVLLLSVGELNENKNHESVIKAINELDLTYVIVGKGEKKEELKAVARKNKVDLRLVGFRNDVADFYAAADAYVLPSIREGLNVSLMEAMACGCACVCGRIRGNVDLIDNESVLFDPFNEDEIRKGIENALRERELLGKNNRETIKNFAKAVVNSKMREIYQNK